VTDLAPRQRTIHLSRVLPRGLPLDPGRSTSAHCGLGFANEGECHVSASKAFALSGHQGRADFIGTLKEDRPPVAVRQGKDFTWTTIGAGSKRTQNRGASKAEDYPARAAAGVGSQLSVGRLW
jgi:hypothetical protein